MSDDQQEKTLGQMLDEDKGFRAARRLLMLLAILLLVSSVGGATIKEANTFIFKIEFLKPKALSLILFLSVVGCCIRYYAFSSPYHKKIRQIWVEKLMGDYRVFFISGDSLSGLLSKKLDYLVSDEPGIQNAEYKNRIFLERKILFLTRVSVTDFESMDGWYAGDDEVMTEISLNEFSDKWKKEDFYKLLMYEAQHRMDTILQNREYLEVLFPYWVAIAAVASYAVSIFFPAVMAS